MMKTLLDILSYRRPDYSASMYQCANAHIVPLGITRDIEGNYIKTIGESPTVLWSSHVDSVHRVQGRQRLAVSNGLIKVAPSKKTGKLPNCLGADDGVGMWLMINMAKAGIPGRYVWHVGEERGSRGSQYISKDQTTLAGIQVAMAFDRRGTNSVITHQASGRCCSDDFATSFINALATAGLPNYQRDQTGIFTDTANYMDLIPECSNLSVGYDHEHSQNESVDMAHACALRDALCTLDTTAFAVVRDPSVIEYDAFDDWHRWSSLWTPTPLASPKRQTYLVDDHDYCDYPIDRSRMWIADANLDTAFHACADSWARTGYTLCNEHIDKPTATWTFAADWAPAEFCEYCLDEEREAVAEQLAAERSGEDWLTRFDY